MEQFSSVLNHGSEVPLWEKFETLFNGLPFPEGPGVEPGAITCGSKTFIRSLRGLNKEMILLRVGTFRFELRPFGWFTVHLQFLLRGVKSF
jgi:hypothetical protein